MRTVGMSLLHKSVLVKRPVKISDRVMHHASIRRITRQARGLVPSHSDHRISRRRHHVIIPRRWRDRRCQH